MRFRINAATPKLIGQDSRWQVLSSVEFLLTTCAHLIRDSSLRAVGHTPSQLLFTSLLLFAFAWFSNTDSVTG